MDNMGIYIFMLYYYHMDIITMGISGSDWLEVPTI